MMKYFRFLNKTFKHAVPAASRFLILGGMIALFVFGQPHPVAQAKSLSLINAPAMLYLPFIRADHNYTISGQILDQNSRAVAGITVQASGAASAITGSDGVYVIGGLVPGTYLVVPQNTNRYYFSPFSRSVTIGASVNGINFKAQPSGGEYINNGGFETISAWDISAVPVMAAYSNWAVHTGTQAMQVGILDPDLNQTGQSKFRQAIPIPNNVSNANLTFWMYPDSNELNATDYQAVYLVDSLTGNTLATLLNQRNNDNAWVKYQFDLTGYAGKYLTIVFAVYNDGAGGVTGMMIDDVSVFITP